MFVVKSAEGVVDAGTNLLKIYFIFVLKVLVSQVKQKFCDKLNWSDEV